MGKTTLVNGLFTRLRSLTRRLGGDDRGNVAMIFAFSVPVIAMMTLGGVDYHRASTARSNLQDALDAATLAAARASTSDPAELTRIGLAALRANLAASPQASELDADDVSFMLDANQVVVANATVEVQTLIANVVLPPYGRLMDETLPISVHSEVNRSSKNVEVALVLDITGSMSGSRIADLRKAARELIDIVVQDADKQDPFYTRAAVVPYSTGVNMGDYAEAARGIVAPSTQITGVEWTTGSTRDIRGITRASEGVVSSTRHGFQNGDFVWIDDVSGMGQVNDRAYRITSAQRDSFKLQSWDGRQWTTVNTSQYGRYDDDGRVRGCLVSNCTLVVTSRNHGLAETDQDTGGPATVYLTGISGISTLNNTGFEIDNVTPNTFSISRSGPGSSAYRSGGQVYCGGDGCQWRVYRNIRGGLSSYSISNCVTERSGSHRNDETSTSTAKVGRLYPANSGEYICPASTLLPLTHKRDDLHELIGRQSDDGKRDSDRSKTGLKAAGFTGGQVGLAWGWYALSPNFASVWPTAPSAYDPTKTLKAIVLMTDGEFNAPFCSGAMARNAGGGGDARIACDSPNGNPFAQSVAICRAIKALPMVGDDPAIRIYTVGLGVGSNRGRSGIDTPIELLEYCSTSEEFRHFPNTGEDLSEAFQDIGRDITRLRISR